MLQEIIVLVFVYICLIGWLNAPKKTTETETTTTDAPIAVSTAPETIAPPQAKPITQPMPKPAYIAPKPKAIAAPTTPTTPKESTTTDAQDLAALPIRKLYPIAQAKGVKRVKSKTKAAILAELAALT